MFRAVDDATATAMLEAAWAAGVRRYDTAPHYGAGLAEHRLGAFLRQHRRDSYPLSTKVGRLLVDTDDDTEGAEGFFGGWQKRRVLDYSAAGVRRSLAESVERMGVGRVDIVLIHDPDDHMDQAIDDGYPALAALRSEGVVSAIGAGMNHAAPLTRLERETDLDVVMVAGRYTLLDRSAEAELLPACVDRACRSLPRRRSTAVCWPIPDPARCTTTHPLRQRCCDARSGSRASATDTASTFGRLASSSRCGIPPSTP
ncbi:MAG TPA: aldo/keto reductase [Mycobacteriales bacterium]|nr:aldo/keto reductase [Mycobacteriales bacterium]